MKKRKTIFLLASVATITTFTGCEVNYLNNISLNKDNTDDTLQNKDEQNIIEEKKTIELSINAFGDLLIHNSVYNVAKKGDTYDFTSQFIDIKDKIIEADYTVGNLEVPIGLKDFSNYPSFRAPAQLADAMKDVLDVELLSTSSNHSLDKGFDGLKTTLDYLDKVGINHVGTYRTEEEANNILIEDINGAKVAFLAYTYGTNGYPIPSKAPYCINLIDKEKIINDSKKAKELGADFIVSKIHFGEEYQLNENAAQKNLVKELFEKSEINLIIGDHPHVVQNIEKMTVTKDGKEKEGVVIYSLGNFISGQNKEYRDTGIIAKANIIIDKENPDNSCVKNIEYTPIFVDRNPNSQDKKIRVVDINKAISDYENKTDNLISSTEYNKLVKYREYYRNKLIIDGFVLEN